MGFAPKADYAPTKILMKALKNAGFKVSTIEEQEHDLEFYGDGEYRNGPGTHPVYYLKISWD